MHNTDKKGFTLIELLVVIAIIALLMAIVIPAISKAKDYAKRTICSSNARQTGLGLKTYAESFDDQLIPMRDQNGGVVDEPMPWEAVIAYSPTYTGPGGDYRPIHLAVLYELGYIGDPEIFYCPAQPRNSAYSIPYYYDFYTGEGAFEWGEECPAAAAGHEWVRTSFNYWTGEKKRFTDLHGSRPLVFDNLQEWEVVPHRKNRLSPTVSPGVPNPASVPQGVSVLYVDGHVSFNTDQTVFDTSLWPLAAGEYNGPGNNKDVFMELLKRLQ